MATATRSADLPPAGNRCGDPYGRLYKSLRRRVLARNGGDCSFCGLSAAVEVHHSGLVYPFGSRVSCCGRRKVGWGSGGFVFGFATRWLPRCVAFVGLGAACSFFRPGLWR